MKIWLWGFGIGALIALIAVLWTAPAPAQTREEWMMQLMKPNSIGSCCDTRHCYRTRSIWKNGSWHAWSRKALDTIEVPPDIIILDPESYDGEAYLCEIGKDPVCFVPPKADAF